MHTCRRRCACGVMGLNAFPVVHHRVSLTVPVSEGVKGRDVKLEVHPKRLRLSVGGKAVLEGGLEDAGEVAVDGEHRSVWEVMGPRTPFTTRIPHGGALAISTAPATCLPESLYHHRLATACAQTASGPWRRTLPATAMWL